jgi:hypothetical protein
MHRHDQREPRHTARQPPQQRHTISRSSRHHDPHRGSTTHRTRTLTTDTAEAECISNSAASAAHRSTHSSTRTSRRTRAHTSPTHTGTHRRRRGRRRDRRRGRRHSGSRLHHQPRQHYHQRYPHHPTMGTRDNNSGRGKHHQPRQHQRTQTLPVIASGTTGAVGAKCITSHGRIRSSQPSQPPHHSPTMHAGTTGAVGAGYIASRDNIRSSKSSRTTHTDAEAHRGGRGCGSRGRGSLHHEPRHTVTRARQQHHTTKATYPTRRRGDA